MPCSYVIKPLDILHWAIKDLKAHISFVNFFKRIYFFINIKNVIVSIQIWTWTYWWYDDDWPGGGWILSRGQMTRHWIKRKKQMTLDKSKTALVKRLSKIVQNLCFYSMSFVYDLVWSLVLSWFCIHKQKSMQRIKRHFLFI